MSAKLSDELLLKLKELARRVAWADNDDFNAWDYSFGNFDDAYWGGQRDGTVMLARDILNSLGIEY